MIRLLNLISSVKEVRKTLYKRMSDLYIAGSKIVHGLEKNTKFYTCIQNLGNYEEIVRTAIRVFTDTMKSERLDHQGKMDKLDYDKGDIYEIDIAKMDWKASLDTFAIKNARATIFLVTTPSNKVGSIAHSVFTVPDDRSLYHRVYLSYKEALGTMLDVDKIELLQTHESFPMMYNLKWGYSFEGSCFSPASIQSAITKPKYTHNPNSDKVMGIDIGYGSSATAYCVLQISDGLIQVLHTSKMVRSDFNDTITKARSLINEYNPHLT